MSDNDQVRPDPLAPKEPVVDAPPPTPADAKAAGEKHAGGEVPPAPVSAGDGGAGAAGGAGGGAGEMAAVAKAKVSRFGSAAKERLSALGAAGTGAVSASGAASPRKAAGRKVKLTVSRIDPWSTAKMSFLVSVAAGIALVVLTAVLWLVLSGMNVFGNIQSTLDSLQANAESPFQISDYIGFGKVLSLSVVVAVIDVVLLTATATVGAFVYNLSSTLVGGVTLTLTDD